MSNEHDFSYSDAEASEPVFFDIQRKHRRRKTPCALPPDDIEPDIIVGNADTASIERESRHPWQRRIMRMISGETPPSIRPLDERKPPPKTTICDNIALHWSVLACLFVATTETIKAFVGLFLHEKSNGINSRLIFDGRAGNIAIIKEEKSWLRLFTLSVLFDLLSLLLRFPDICIVDGDLRQFYYQCGFHIGLAVYFGCCINGVNYLPKAMPMGFHNASLFGQTITLSAIIFALAHEPCLGIDVAALNTFIMPRIIYLYEECWGPTPSGPSRTICGAIVALMDGFIILVRGRARATEWRARIWRNMARYRLRLKPISPIPSNAKKVDTSRPDHFLRLSDWSRAPHNFITFAGIDIRGGPNPGWRPNKDAPSLPPLSDEGEAEGSTSEVSSLLGKLHWQLRVFDLHPLDHLDILRLWSRITPTDARDKKEWKKPVTLSCEEVSAFRRTCEAIPHRDLWYIRPVPVAPALCFYIISDAYTEAIGFLIFDASFRLIAQVHVDIPGDQASQEMLAIIDAIDICVKLAHKWGFPSVGIIFGTDADGVRSSIEKGYSTKPSFVDHLIRLRAIRSVFPVRLAGARVPGIVNISDIISRRSNRTAVPEFACPLHDDAFLNCPHCFRAIASHHHLPASLDRVLQETAQCPWWVSAASPQACTDPLWVPAGTDPLPSKQLRAEPRISHNLLEDSIREMLLELPHPLIPSTY